MAFRTILSSTHAHGQKYERVWLEHVGFHEGYFALGEDQNGDVEMVGTVIDHGSLVQSLSLVEAAANYIQAARQVMQVETPPHVSGVVGEVLIAGGNMGGNEDADGQPIIEGKAYIMLGDGDFEIIVAGPFDDEQSATEAMHADWYN